MRTTGIASVSVLVLGAAACGLDLGGTLGPATTGVSDAGSGGPPLFDAGGLDASSGGDASPTTFCAGHTMDPTVIHCWDFEGPTTSIGTLDPVMSNVGTIAVLSAGGSQVMSITLPFGAGSRAAWVTKGIGAFGPGATTYQIQFRFAIPDNSLDYAAIGGFDESFGSIFGVASYGYGSLMHLSVTNPPVTSLPTTAGPNWHTALVELAQAPVRPNGKVTIDGTLVASEVWDVGATPTLDLRLGAYYTSGNPGSYQVLFDDVLVRRQ